MTWIGQKPEPEPEPARPAPPTAGPDAHRAAPPPAVWNREKPEMIHAANIGKSLQIKGELSGNEDLTIEGRVEGKISLDGHNLTIGENGRVTAEIQATSVVVGGELRGNITAEQNVEVAATGTMLGDIRAPRVALADGARFKGSIDMDASAVPGPRPVKPHAQGRADDAR
jgi:cytoskeletal protein CcmA (bactofilin family)